MSLVGLEIHKHRVHAGGKISRVKNAASTEIKHITHEEKTAKKQIEKKNATRFSTSDETIRAY